MTLPYLVTRTDELPMTPSNGLLSSAIAARMSWEQQDREVLFSEISAEVGYDGAAFAESYRRARYPTGS